MKVRVEVIQSDSRVLFDSSSMHRLDLLNFLQSQAYLNFLSNLKGFLHPIKGLCRETINMHWSECWCGQLQLI